MMSNFFKIALVAIIVSVSFSCSSDDEGPKEAPQVKLRAQIGGSSFRTDDATGILSNDGKLLVITATTDTGQTLTLRVGDVAGGDNSFTISADTYLIAEDNVASIGYTRGGIIYSSDFEEGGAITISSLDKEENTIFGSFSGTVKSIEADDLIIDSGFIFNVSFTEQ